MAALLARAALGADVLQGARLFEAACGMCHYAERIRGVRVGPNLSGVLGRTVGSEDYPYSVALRQLDGVWDAERLDAFLSAPMKRVPGTAMTFSGLGNADDRHAVIDYLQTLTPH